MSHSFDERAATWDDDGKITRAQSVAATITATIGPTTSMSLLEYGAGTGLVAQFLAPHVGAVTLADTSMGMREVAQQKIDAGVLPPTTRLWDLDLATQDTPAEKFDLIVTVLALHHVADIPRTLAGFAALLAAGGRLCIVDLEAEDGSFHDHADDVAHGFGEAELSRDLAAAGLTSEYHHGIYQLDKEGRDYPLFLAVCRAANQ